MDLILLNFFLGYWICLSNGLNGDSFALQRVKNPPIPLRDFASIESMKEEINEIVAFLRNPRAFQEMGARAPRVCYSKDTNISMLH